MALYSVLRFLSPSATPGRVLCAGTARAWQHNREGVGKQRNMVKSGPRSESRRAWWGEQTLATEGPIHVELAPQKTACSDSNLHHPRTRPSLKELLHI